MQNGFNINGWIPCEKQMPPEIGVYEVTIEKDFSKTKKYTTDFVIFAASQVWMTTQTVIAWRERTQPYVPVANQ